MVAMPTTSLSVVVIGGGIGGLTSAIAMRKAGHRVTVKTLRDIFPIPASQ